MENVYHISSEVIVGSSAGASNYYPGAVKAAGTYTDNFVTHPDQNRTCYTRPVYFKSVGGAPFIDLSKITKFTSMAPV